MREPFAEYAIELARAREDSVDFLVGDVLHFRRSAATSEHGTNVLARVDEGLKGAALGALAGPDFRLAFAFGAGVHQGA